MKYTFQLVKIYQIPLKIHWSFSLLILYVAGSAWYQNASKEAIFLHSAFIIAIFTCILLHELGHAAAAAFHGVKTKEIILLPIGGAAVFEQKLVRPLQEFTIAFAGPLTNFTIAALIFIGLKIFTPSSVTYIGIEDQLFSVGNAFFERLMWLNIIIAAFNLIPAFPLDGGLMLRSILCSFFNRRKAVRFQFFFSIFIALLFVVYSYLNRAPEYLLFAYLVYFSSRKEWEKVRVNE